MTGSTTPKTPAEVVAHYLQTFFGHDIDKTLDCLTDDVSWHVQGAPGVPTVGDRQGKDEVRQWLQLFPDHFEPIAFEVLKTFEKEDDVVLVGHFTHRIIDTGKHFTSRFAAVCTVRDGKVSDYDFLEDSFGLWNSFQPEREEVSSGEEFA